MGNAQLTIFTCPKPFAGEFERIQNIAIESWIAIGAEVVLVENAATNQYGTPLLSDIFERGEAASETEIVAYVNTDIVLFQEFNQAWMRCAEEFPHFLMSGQRFDLKYDLAAIDNTRAMAQDIRHHPDAYGHWLGAQGADYFVYRKGDLGAIPPFAVGRFRTDNWLMWRALSHGLAFVDATEALMALHQPHGYNHAPGEVERFINDTLVGTDGGELKRLTDATHVLTADFQLQERVQV